MGNESKLHIIYKLLAEIIGIYEFRGWAKKNSYLIYELPTYLKNAQLELVL